MKGRTVAIIDYMLTTIDNPYDPFTHYDEWLAYDEERGYFTPALLARVAYTSHELSEKDNDLAIDLAINEIVMRDVSGMYIKTRKKNKKA